MQSLPAALVTSHRLHTRAEAERRLDAFLTAAERSGFAASVCFVYGLRKWRAEFLAYFDQPATNGHAEGITNKIKVIKRRAYGAPPFHFSANGYSYAAADHHPTQGDLLDPRFQVRQTSAWRLPAGDRSVTSAPLLTRTAERSARPQLGRSVTIGGLMTAVAAETTLTRVQARRIGASLGIGRAHWVRIESPFAEAHPTQRLVSVTTCTAESAKFVATNADVVTRCNDCAFDDALAVTSRETGKRPVAA